MPEEATYPSEFDERVVRIENMRADARLKGVQAPTEVWKVGATMLGVGVGVGVGLMGAGAGLFAAALAFAKWWYGVGPS